MLLLGSLLLFVYAHYAAAQCRFVRGGYGLKWEVDRANVVHFELVRQGLDNRERWFGFAIGNRMRKLDTIIVKKENSGQSVVDGSTSGYWAPSVDSQNDVQVESVSFVSGTLRAKFSRPMNTGDRKDLSLDGCFTLQHAISGGTLRESRIGKHHQPLTAQRVCNIASRCAIQPQPPAPAPPRERVAPPPPPPATVCPKPDTRWCSAYVDELRRTNEDNVCGIVDFIKESCCNKLATIGC